MPIDTEPRFVIRHYEPNVDLANLSRLLTNVEAYDQDGENTSEEALREQLTWQNHDPAQDCWVALSSDKSRDLIGYASCFAQTPERSTLYVAVHPLWRNIGLGSTLLACVLHRARERDASQVLIYANAKNMATNSFLQQHELRVFGDAWTMCASATLSIQQLSLLSGYSICSHSHTQDVNALANVCNHSFCDKWGHTENTKLVTVESVQRWLPNYDPEGIFLAFAPDQSVVGICRAKHTSEQDTVECPGVVPEHRDKGLYRALALTAMSWLRAQGQRDITLESWGDDENTIAEYRDIGFVLVQHYLAYQKSL